MHYFLSNVFDYNTTLHLPLAPLWQNIMIFYAAYLCPEILAFPCMFVLKGRLGFREAGNWGDWNDQSLFDSVLLFFSKSYVQIAWVKNSISRIPDKTHLFTILHLESNRPSQVWLYNIYNKGVMAKWGSQSLGPQSLLVFIFCCKYFQHFECDRDV